VPKLVRCRCRPSPSFIVCPANTRYDDSGTPVACTNCASGEYLAATTLTDDQAALLAGLSAGTCSACSGTGAVAKADGSGCECPANTYLDAASGNCDACPSNMISTAGSDAATDCSCPAGYAYTAGSGGAAGTCTACAAGTYNANAANEGDATNTCGACSAGQIPTSDKTACQAALGAAACTAAVTGSEPNSDGDACGENCEHCNEGHLSPACPLGS
jgi:hypothetical protein